MDNGENKQSLIEKIKQNKKLQYMIVAVLSIIAILILIANYSEKGENEETADVVERYVCELEEKLTNTLKKVNGAGDVSVVITVESGMQTVIAMNTTIIESENGREIVETPVIINGKTVVLKEMYPKIKGVLIVAEGASQIKVLSNIQQAAVSLLDINLSQIEILTMK